MFVEPSPLPEGSRLCCSSLKASTAGMFPGTGVGIRGRACLGCCPSAGFVALLCFELGLCFGKGRETKSGVG